MKVGMWTQAWALSKQIQVDYFPSLDSTSNYAKTLMSDPQENHYPLRLVIAESQTSGRGRGLNSWVNGNAGSALLTTWSFRLTRPPQPIMSARIGLGLFQAATKVWPDVPFSLKAPNDLYLGTKKVAGILLEAIEQGPHIRLLIGLGLNVLENPNLETATSLKNMISPELIEANWPLFLTELYRELQVSCDQVSIELNDFDTQRLTEALNAFPGLKQAYSKVDPDGSLWIGSQKIHWSQL